MNRSSSLVFLGLLLVALAALFLLCHKVQFLLPDCQFCTGFAALSLSCLVGDPMNKFLVGFIAGVFVGVLLAPVFSPEVIVLAAIILLALAVVLMYLFHRGVMDFQDYE